ncbi:MAG TPA: cellulase family glycosylhydrolase [Clostridia bacterium]|nr:cellulase family glycosylhydrolase [Clostridia bacterium]
MKIKKANKALAIGCALGILAASAGMLVGAAASGKAYRQLGKSDRLKTDGRRIRNARGETVLLRGVNLDDWLLQESRMSPANGEDKLWGHYDTLQTLIERFGDDKADELLNTYLDNRITVFDLDYLKSLGANCVRVPFCYRNFQSDDKGTWRRNEKGDIDFSRLDWIVAECGKRGLYVILDLHGAPGFRSNDHSCGKVNASKLFDLTLEGLKYRRQTADLWAEIAAHFKGNPALAAFDLLNEPMKGFAQEDKNDCKLWRFYNKLYKAVRTADPDRMITVEAVWEMENLPSPKLFCWENIVYQLHIYNRTMPEIDQKMADIKTKAKWNVPVMVGEFQAGGMWEYTMSAFNENELSWCTRSYKGIKRQESDRFLFTNEIETADLQEDSFEQIKTKWGKACKSKNGFVENTELAAVLKKYLNGYVGSDEENNPPTSEPYCEVWDEMPTTDTTQNDKPMKVAFGRATLVGMGTLASLTSKKNKNSKK